MKLIKLTAIMAILSACAALIAGCGGGGAAGAALVIAKSGKSDNPIIPMPAGHPNRIVYKSFPSSAPDGTLLSMDPSGANKLTITTSPSESRSFIFTSPAVSQNGLQIYFASDWYSTTTDIMTSRIDGMLPTPLIRNSTINLETPRVSWDGTKIAFSGYEEREVTAVIHPSRAFVTSDDIELPEQNANIGLTGGGEWLYSKSGTLGLCSKSCSQCDISEFSELLRFATFYNSAQTEFPEGKTYCVAIDEVNRVNISVTDHTYLPPGAGSITFTWQWLQNPHPETFGPITLDGSLNGTTRIGMGYNFINTFNFKKYDIFTADIDGSNVVQHTDDDDPARFPCFSPVGSDFIYYAQGILDTAYMEYEFPESSNLYELDLTTGAKTLLFSGSMDRHCSVSPSGKLVVFSRYNDETEEYDLYLHDLDTGLASLLIDTGGNDLYPVFSPSGAYVAFQSDLTIDDDIFTVKIDGTGLTNVTNNRIDDRMPAWAP